MAQEHGVIRGIAKVLRWALAVGVFVAAGAMTAGMPVLDAATPSITAQEWKFAPSTIEVQSGASVVVRNAGQVPHDVTIDSGAHTGFIAPGREGTLVVNLPAGTYTFYCSQPAHRQMGMVGTLTVR